MKGSRFTEAQIIRVVKAIEGGLSVEDACRQFGVSRNTVYAWRKKFGGLELSEAKRLRGRKKENRPPGRPRLTEYPLPDPDTQLKLPISR